MMCRTALPLLISLTYRAYWYCNVGDYIEETPIILKRLIHSNIRLSDV